MAVGAAAFALSDLSVAYGRFIRPRWTAKAWGLPLYYAAQLVLAGSVPPSASTFDLQLRRTRLPGRARSRTSSASSRFPTTGGSGMSLVTRFLARFSALVILGLALVQLSAQVQAAAAPAVTPTVPHGIDLAGHGPLRRARGRLLRLRQRHLAEEPPRSPPTAARTGAGDVLERTDDQADGRPDQAGGGQAKAPAGSEARKIGDYYASLHGRGGHRGQGA